MECPPLARARRFAWGCARASPCRRKRHDVPCSWDAGLAWRLLAQVRDVGVLDFFSVHRRNDAFAL